MADQTVTDTTVTEYDEDELSKMELDHLESAHKEPNDGAETEDNPNGVPAETHTHSRVLHVTHTHPIYEDAIHA